MTDRSTAARHAILSAALRRFVAQGYAGTSMSEIVQDAGTSVGLPYYHFGSKKQIFMAIWTDYQEDQWVRTAAAAARAHQAGRSGTAQYLAGVQAYLEGAWEHRDLVPLMHGPTRPADFDQTLRDNERRWNRYTRALLSDPDPDPGPEHGPETGADPGTRNLVLMLNEALSAICVAVAECQDADQAARTIDDVVALVSGVLQPC